MPVQGSNLRQQLDSSTVPTAHLDLLLATLLKSTTSTSTSSSSSSSSSSSPPSSPQSLPQSFTHSSSNPPSLSTSLPLHASTPIDIDTGPPDQLLVSILEFVDQQSLHSYFFYRLFEHYLTSEFTTVVSHLFYLALQQALQSPLWFEAIPHSFQHFENPVSLQHSFDLQTFLSKFDLSHIELLLLALSFITTCDSTIQSQAETFVRRHQSVFYLHTQSNPIPPFLKERFDLYSNSSPVETKSTDLANALDPNEEYISLANILRVTGCNVLATVEAFRRIITKLLTTVNHATVFHEKSIAQCISFMCMHLTDYSPSSTTTSSSSDHPSSTSTSSTPWERIVNETVPHKKMMKWSIDVFLTLINEHQPTLNWVKVIEHLDLDTFQLQSLQGLEFILEIYKKGNKHKKFPIQVLFKPWQHPYSQYLFLAQLVSASPNVFNFADYTLHETPKVVDPEELAIYSSSSSTLTPIVTLPNQALNCLDVWKTLLHLLTYPDCHASVKEFLDNASTKAPELFLLGLVQLPPPWDPIHSLKVNELTHQFFRGTRSTSNFVLTQFWRLAPECLLTTLVHLSATDPTLLHTWVEFLITFHKEGLEFTFLTLPYALALEMGAFLCRRDASLVVSEEWFEKRLNKEQGSTTLENKIEKLQPPGKKEKEPPSQREREKLEKRDHKLKEDKKSKKEDPEFKTTGVTTLAESDAKDLKVGTGTSGTTSSSSSSTSTTKEQGGGGSAWLQACIDFFKMYIHPSPPPSSSERSLIPSNYAKHLVSFIQHHSTHPSLPLDLQEALSAMQLKLKSAFRHEIEEQVIDLFDLFYTGEMTLNHLIHQLITMKEVSEPTSEEFYLCLVTTFMDEAKFLHTYPESNVVIAGLFLGQLLFHRLLNPELTERALRFILNSLNQLDTHHKMFHFGYNALSQFLQCAFEVYPEFIPALLDIPLFVYTAPDMVELIQNKLNAKWFAAVNPDRALIHPDLHSFTDPPPDTVQDKLLFVLNNLSPNNFDSKYKEAKDLLTQPSYRWFSNYLVTQRAPMEPNFHQLYLQFLKLLDLEPIWNCILFETLHLVETLMNSDKILESSTERMKLKHLGSWLGGLTLARDKPLLHKHVALKPLLMEGFLHNRLMVVVPFVCKVLEQCKFSKIFVPPNPWLMANISFLVELYQFVELKLNLKFEIEVLCNQLNLNLNDVGPSQLIQHLNPLQLSFAGFPNLHMPDATNISMKSIDHLISQMANLSTHAVPTSSSSSFSESMAASNSTTQSKLTLPFLSTSPSASSSLPVTSGTIAPGSLASSLTNVSVASSTVAPSATTTTASSSSTAAPPTNAATSANPFQVPSGAHSQLNSGTMSHASQLPPFPHHSATTNMIPSSFHPTSMSMGGGGGGGDPLRIKSTGLSMHQWSAYEEYGRVMVPEESIQETMKICIDKFTHYMTQLEGLLTHSSFTKQTDIPMQHEIRELLRQIPLILPHNQISEHLALLFCSKVIQPLYSTSLDLARDAYAFLLRELCSQSVAVGKEVIQWLLYSEDERKYNEHVTCSLIKCGLIHLNDLDVQLAKLMEAGKDIFHYTIRLIQVCNQHGVAIECDWFNVLDVLNRMLLSSNASAPTSSASASASVSTHLPPPPEIVKTFMTQFRQRFKTITNNGIPFDPLDPKSKEQAQWIHEQLAYTFAEWVRLFHHPSTNEAMLHRFILELLNYPIFSNDDTFCLFFRICTQISVDAWLKSYKSTSSPALA
ncbi:hypothetical protein HMI54_015364, partial [Coelomomyces lativittatus]